MVTQFTIKSNNKAFKFQRRTKDNACTCNGRAISLEDYTRNLNAFYDLIKISPKLRP